MNIWNGACNLGFLPSEHFLVIWSDGLHLQIDGPVKELIKEYDGELNILDRTTNGKSEIETAELLESLSTLGVVIKEEGERHDIQAFSKVTFIVDDHSKTANEVVNTCISLMSQESFKTTFYGCEVDVVTPQGLDGIGENMRSRLFIAIGLNPKDFYRINKKFSYQKIEWIYVYSPSFNMVLISNLTDYKNGCYKCLRGLHIGSLPHEHMPIAANIESWIENDQIHLVKVNDISIEAKNQYYIALTSSFILVNIIKKVRNIVHTITFDDLGVEVNRSATIALPQCGCCT
ncbi:MULTISPECIES: hypothetical protein [Acidithiobacillus]|jgi:hypothetical protein|uniref:Uncharacterized protein n=2 Tax=Acidithiobacillus ferrooxidans TaxID=920 RepID=B7J4V6_ACIF2|nr:MULTISPECIES: hypothetical protein [Acidithiobacillus]MCL4526776.1 hypothetical protein [Gammaproteobacteria bacterium]MDA8376015.1 hypothetical protein [Planctomycetia bacterium]ACH83973.1 hypothetical protein Lferr_1752 [Acidithiobacillus ferrooxidans ATCC 53993]ACK79832.1 hypothetical protein AFE_2096 [Acidithiobacillus ferrooxidans ATCC 23270]MBN6744040.1 hypothetical protein [Acidithiobacillus sp. MC2.2]